MANLIKIVKIAVSTALLAALLVVVAVVVAMVSGAVPYKMYVVRTGSMTPTIPPESAVIVRSGVYHLGQPVAYRKGSEVIAHRLVAINADGTINTKGDANRTIDPWHVPVGNIVGGVVAAPHRLGWWIVYFKNPVGMASFALALLCFWLIWSIADEASHESDPDLQDTHPAIA